MITFEINRLVKGSHAQNSAFPATFAATIGAPARRPGRSCPRRTADSRAIFEPLGLIRRLTAEGKPTPPLPNCEGSKSGTQVRSQVRRVMRVQSGQWLDYDPLALVVLVLGIGAVALIAFTI
jgi:hypothetical protein